LLLTRNSILQRGSRVTEGISGNQRRYNLRGNGFTPANRIHAFIGLRLKVNLLYGYAERFGQRLPHLREMRAQLRFSRITTRPRVRSRFLLFQQLLGMFQEPQTIGALPLWIAVRKMRPDISKPAAPSSASQTACASTSPSECPTGPCRTAAQSPQR